MKSLSLNYLIKQIQQYRLNKNHERLVGQFLTENKIDYFTKNNALCFAAKLPLIPSIAQFELRKNSSDFATFLQFLKDSHFQSVITKAKAHGIKINSIIDAGANIGLATLFFKLHFPQAIVISIEPESSNFKQLDKHIKLNKLKNVILEQAAVWYKTESLHLQNPISPKNNWGFQVSPKKHGNVQGHEILYFLKKYDLETIDLLKIDIEGSEQILFKEDYNTSLFLNKTKIISIEVHEKYISIDQVKKTLTKCSFEIYQSGELLLGINNRFNSL